jgi:hypothetical protein
MSLAEENQAEHPDDAIDENFGEYPHDRFMDAVRRKMSPRDYARDVLARAGLRLG